MSQLFRYKDLRAQAFQDPWPSVNVATALRAAKDLLTNGTMPSHYAEDFELWLVGQFDTEGPVEGLPPKQIINLKELVNDE